MLSMDGVHWSTRDNAIKLASSRTKQTPQNLFGIGQTDAGEWSRAK